LLHNEKLSFLTALVETRDGSCEWFEGCVAAKTDPVTSAALTNCRAECCCNAGGEREWGASEEEGARVGGASIAWRNDRYGGRRGAFALAFDVYSNQGIHLFHNLDFRFCHSDQGTDNTFVS